MLICFCSCGNNSNDDSTSSESEVSTINSEVTSNTPSTESVSSETKKPFVAPDPINFTEGGIEYIKYHADDISLFTMYGNETTVVMMNGVSTSGRDTTARYDCIRAAAEECIKNHPDNIKFIDRDILETWNIEIGNDTTHPSANGYATLCTRITEYLADNFQ